MSRQKAIIIGAGIGGIATANLLAKAGYEVEVYEKHDSAGGRARVIDFDGFHFDTGPSWYLMPDAFEHYYNLLDTTTSKQLDLLQLKPAYKVFFENDQPIVISTDPEKDKAMFEAIEPGAGRALERYVDRGDRIYQLAIKHFLYTNFTSIRDFLKPSVIWHGPGMLGMALTSIDRYIGRFFKDARLKHILEYTMVFLGASPYNAPAIYSLMGALDFREGVFYPRGGMYKLIESLLQIGQSLGVTYHYNADVTQIRTDKGLVRGITLSDGSEIDADIVISNADLHFTETKLLDHKDQTYPDKYWKNRHAGPSALLLYLGVKGELPELEHHSLLFVDDWRGNFDAIYKTQTIPESASIYLSRASANDPTVAPAGHEAVVVLVPLPSGISLDDSQQNKLADEYIEQIAVMTGVKDFASRIVARRIMSPDDFKNDFNAWRSTALGPSHNLLQSAFLRTSNKSKKVKNLYYVGGSTIPGIGLPMCIIGAELVYKHLANEKLGGRVNKIKTIGKRRA